jgi:hypothetical protein
VKILLQLFVLKLDNIDLNTQPEIFQNCLPPPKSNNKKITLPHWESASPVENKKKKNIKLLKN